MNENIENRLRCWATTASEPLPLITDGSVVVNVIEVDGPRSGDLRRLADLVAAVRAMSQHEDRYEHCRGIDWGAYDRAVAALAALDEASR